MSFLFLKEKRRKRSKNLAGLSLVRLSWYTRLQEPARTNTFVRPPRWRLRNASLVDSGGKFVRMGIFNAQSMKPLTQGVVAREAWRRGLWKICTKFQGSTCQGSCRRRRLRGSRGAHCASVNLNRFHWYSVGDGVRRVTPSASRKIHTKHIRCVVMAERGQTLCSSRII